MNTPTPPPERPYFSDALYQALNPIQKMIQDKKKVEALKDKYGIQRQTIQPEVSGTMPPRKFQ